ncbi:serine/threonine-protein kinase 17B-like [Lampetra fluviatilis]
MNRLGMLLDVQTRIRKEPFASFYTVVGNELGRGKFAVVRRCVEVATGIEFAAKFLRKRRKGQDCRADVTHEMAILEAARSCPHIIDLHDAFETPTEIILVLEYAVGGEIFNQCVAEGEDAFTEGDVRRLMRQILEGVAFLHRNDVVHLDLKPQNILLTSASPLGDIKIVDFGLSRRVNSAEELREIMGTPEYVAPEVLNYEPISKATDMWSVGVLAYVMLTGESPFLGEDKQETFLNVSQLNVSYEPEVFEGVSVQAVAFIQQLLVKAPHRRATADHCLRHPWLSAPAPVGTCLDGTPSRPREDDSSYLLAEPKADEVEDSAIGFDADEAIGSGVSGGSTPEPHEVRVAHHHDNDHRDPGVVPCCASPSEQEQDSACDTAASDAEDDSELPCAHGVLPGWMENLVDGAGRMVELEQAQEQRGHGRELACVAASWDPALLPRPTSPSAAGECSVLVPPFPLGQCRQADVEFAKKATDAVAATNCFQAEEAYAIIPEMQKKLVC